MPKNLLNNRHGMAIHQSTFKLLLNILANRHLLVLSSNFAMAIQKLFHANKLYFSDAY